MLYASCVLFLILTTGLKACVIIICALYMREWILRSGKGKMWVLNPNLYDWSPHIVSPPHCLSHRWRNSLLPVPEGRKVGKGWKSSKAGEDEAEAPVSHLHQAIMFYFNFPQTYSSVTLGWKKKRKKKSTTGAWEMSSITFQRTCTEQSKCWTSPNRCKPLPQSLPEAHHWDLKRAAHVASPADFPGV